MGAFSEGGSGSNPIHSPVTTSLLWTVAYTFCSRHIQGQPGEQWTMFFKDPSGNNLEFKAMTNPANLFAKYNVDDVIDDQGNPIPDEGNKDEM